MVERDIIKLFKNTKFWWNMVERDIIKLLQNTKF